MYFVECKKEQTVDRELAEPLFHVRHGAGIAVCQPNTHFRLLPHQLNSISLGAVVRQGKTSSPQAPCT